MLKQLIFTVCRVLTWVLSKPDLAFKISSQDRLTIKRRVLSLQGYSHTKDASSVVCLQFTFMVTCTSEHYLFLQNHLVLQFTDFIQGRQLNSVIYSFLDLKSFSSWRKSLPLL